MTNFEFWRAMIVVVLSIAFIVTAVIFLEDKLSIRKITELMGEIPLSVIAMVCLVISFFILVQNNVYLLLRAFALVAFCKIAVWLVNTALDP